jgi:O-antigen ligase
MAVVERALFGALIFVPIAFWPWSNDPFLMPKLAILLPAGFFMLTASILKIKALGNRNSKLMFGLITLLLTLLSASLLFTSGNLTEKFYGYFTRNNGFLTYLSLLGFFLISYLYANKINLAKISLYGRLISVVALLVGFLQNFKVNLANLNPNNSVVGVLGNVNFQSAFLGMMSAFFIYEIFNKDSSVLIRVLNFLISLFLIIEILMTKSIQGLVLFIVNFIVIMLYYLKTQNLSIRIPLIIVFTTIFFPILGIFNKGPLAKYLFDLSTLDRGYCWEAGIKIAQQNPFIGVGFDQYRHYYQQFRSESAVKFQNQNFNHICDTAHNIFIDLAANNGLPLALICILIVIATFKKLFKIVIDMKSFDLRFASLIGFWIGYQVQSIISINHIGLAIWGWVITGLILGVKKNTTPNTYENIRGVYRVPVLSYFAISFSLGAIIILPMANKYTNFYLAQFQSTNNRLVEVSIQKPLVMPFMFAASQSASNLGDYETALKIGLIATEQFPNSTDAWRLIIDNPLTSQSQLIDAKININRLGAKFP